jgi:hypothetical protein
MNNETSGLYGSGNSFEANGPTSEASNEQSRFKEYGKKSLAPLTNLLHKYKSEVDPYFSAIAKGFDGAVSVLANEPSDADRTVSRWFQEASTWLGNAKEKFQSADAKELLQYLEEETRKHPGLMFSSSYIAGMAFGRLGRHLGRQASKDQESSFKH